MELFAIDTIAEDPAADLHFLHAGLADAPGEGAGAAAADDRDIVPRCPASRGARRQQGDRRHHRPLLQSRVGNADGMAFPAHDAAQREARPCCDRIGKRHHGRPRFDASPLHADIDLDDHGQHAVGGNRSSRQGVHVGDAVDGNDGLGPSHQRDQPRDLGRADDLVRQQDVADPRRRHDLGLAKLGAGDADGAGGKRLAGDLRGLQALDMRAPVDAALPTGGGDPRNIRFHDVEVDDERRGVERVMAASSALLRFGCGVGLLDDAQRLEIVADIGLERTAVEQPVDEMADHRVEARLVSGIEIELLAALDAAHQGEHRPVEDGARPAARQFETIVRAGGKARCRHVADEGDRRARSRLEEERCQRFALDRGKLASGACRQQLQGAESQRSTSMVLDQHFGDGQALLVRHEGLALERRPLAGRIGKEAGGDGGLPAQRSSPDIRHRRSA